MDYRYPTENRILALTLVLTAMVVFFTTSFTLGGIAALVVVGLGFRYASIRAHIQAVRTTGIPVAEVPRVEALVERCRAELGLVEELEVYVIERDVLNAYAIGLGAPYVVVIYTGLLKALDEDELLCVIGHELGHVHFGHTRILALVGQTGSHTMGAGIVQMLLRRVIFLFWMRASEFTADRAGLVACRNLDKALSTELKVALGGRWRDYDVNELIRHYRSENVGIQLGSLWSTHPDMHARMDRLVDFYDSELYGRIVDG